MGDKGVIQWPLSTSPGQRPQENRGRLVNCYAEPLGEQSGAVWKRAPGAASYGTTEVSEWNFWGLEVFPFSPPEDPSLPTGIYRGGIYVSGTLYAVLGTTLYTIVQGGGFTAIGTVAGSDKVFFARNFVAPVPDICMVCDAGPFVVTSIAILPYPDPDVGSPKCVVGMDGFFIFGYGNGDMITTDVNTTNINLLNLARNDSNPHTGVTQLVSFKRQLYSFGETACEVWAPPVNTSGFPYNKTPYDIHPGLMKHHAIAGFEPEFGMVPVWVGSDATVRALVNDVAAKISPPQLDRLIEAVPVSGIMPRNVEALVYVSDGVPFCEISSPTFTWVVNIRSIDDPKWNEKESYLLTRSRLTQSIFAFDTWLCGDTQAEGRMIEIIPDLDTEVGLPLIPTLESLPVEDFPTNIACPRADFEFTPGVGIAAGHDPDQTDPYCEVSWSDDGGTTFRAPRFVPLGRQGKTFTKITVWRTGLSGPQGRRWRLSVPSAVHMAFIGGVMRQLSTGWP